MDIIISVLRSAAENGFVLALTALALFLSYLMLNICDLSTDGCFTLGAAIGIMAARSADPYLSILAAMVAGMISGFVVAMLQTKLGVNSLLAGIIVNTGLYSINMTVMEGKANVSVGKSQTVFTRADRLFCHTFLKDYSDLIVLSLFVGAAFVFLALFLKTRLGLSLRATGNNPDMVKSSSINPTVTVTLGLCLSNALTALSGCLMAQKSGFSDINFGTGTVTVALAALLIGKAFFGKGKIPLRLFGMVLGSFLYYLVYAVALKLDIPTYMLKLVSSVIVFIAISAPYLKSKIPQYKRRFANKEVS